MITTTEERLRLAIGVIKAEDEYAFLEAAQPLCGINDEKTCTHQQLVEAAARIVLTAYDHALRKIAMLEDACWRSDEIAAARLLDVQQLRAEVARLNAADAERRDPANNDSIDKDR